MKLPPLGHLRRSLFRIGAKPARVFLKQALRDEPTYDWLTHTMGNKIAMTESDIASSIPDGLTRIDGFEDCSWLYSSNPMNHGASRLRFDEAAYLYKMISKMDLPSIVEIGRYKGGTTFLMAAAGAQVTSLDNGRVPGQERLTKSLIATLERFDLDSRADVIIADALEYAAEPHSFDMVFLDNGLDSFEMGKEFFEYWWAAIKKGGYFLFRDGKNTVLRHTARFVMTLRKSDIDGSVDFDLPGAFVLVTKRS